MTRYRINSRRVALKEFRTEASLPLAVLAWGVTRLPINIPSSSECPAVDSLQAYAVLEPDIPRSAQVDLEQRTSSLNKLGFAEVVRQRIEDTEQQTTHFHVTWQHESGAVLARWKYRVFRGATPHKIYQQLELISRLRDGTFVVTSSGRGDLEGPRAVHEQLFPGTDTAELWEQHRERLTTPAWQGMGCRLGDERTVLAALEELHHHIVEHQIARVVFVPVEESLTRATEVLAAAPEAKSGDDDQLLQEVRRQEAGRGASKTSSALLLLVSIGLFIALGGYAWSWEFMLFLVPILLFHEAGHYLSMKLFDYRNVRMFFIPLFGAAVSGHTYNVPG